MLLQPLDDRVLDLHIPALGRTRKRWGLNVCHRVSKYSDPLILPKTAASFTEEGKQL